METKEKLKANKYTKVMLPAINYDFASDSRLLIPFTNGNKIGFVNNEGVIVVNAKYNVYYGDCYASDEFIRVGVNIYKSYPRSGGKVAIYDNYLYGLINCEGEVILPIEYLHICPAIGNKNLFTVQRKDYLWGVITAEGEEIVPFGKYDWIDGFNNGYARVTRGDGLLWNSDHKCKVGLIDEVGTEIFPVEYYYIQKFYNKNLKYITLTTTNGDTRIFYFSKEINKMQKINIQESCDYDDYGTHYGEYAGTYAQDVMEYSDDVINDAFDGEADAYWNID